jgi:hypothetical protein
MLALDVGHAPATRLLIRVAQRVGELAAMCLKHAFRVPRPHQLCPAIVPMLDPPATPSFPSGHALQAHLISRCLKDVRGENRLEKVPAEDRAGAPPGVPQTERLLDELAARIAENREIAGLHYPYDSEGGRIAAEACYDMLTKPEKKEEGKMFSELVTLARQEFPSREAVQLKAAVKSPAAWGPR